jgi:hypothetical protein
VKSTAHRGRPRKKKPSNVVDLQQLAQATLAGDDAIAAALEFAKRLKEAA